MTKTFKIQNIEKDIKNIEISAQTLKAGGTVVFPTETVYGLGANALDEKAVEKIFIAKGRPADNPLIVHIWNIKQIEEVASEIPVMLKPLAEKFWPGPLTLVVKKSKAVSEIVTAGLDTVGIRMPDNNIALQLLKFADVPVAAPSANISGSPSPTSASHVLKDLDGRVDVIIDGGDCRVGLESTVLDISGEVPIILRPGAVTFEQIKEVTGRVDTDRHINIKMEESVEIPRSPGVKYKHYSPEAEVILVDGSIDKIVKEIESRAKAFLNQGKRVGIMATEQTKKLYNTGLVFSAGDRDNPETIAANLFRLLRKFDEEKVDIVFMEAIEKNGIGMAIMNRMIRAAGYNVIRAD
ncbi:MAG: L-threonylcarbamoyladenylate synthase [Deltaproteobacteria bacterium]